MFEKILVVCAGNICRSPTAERLLQQVLPQKKIDSAGLVTQKSSLIGKPADTMACQVATAQGLSLEGHQAKQLTASMCHDFDLILVMEQKHIESITQIAPEARGKTMLLGQFHTQVDIPDPYRLSQEMFELAYASIDASAQAWHAKLSI